MKKILKLSYLIFAIFYPDISEAGWNKISESGVEFPTAFSFADENNGVIAGFFGMKYSSDGGMNWIQINPGVQTVTKIKFTGIDTGYLIGKQPGPLSGLYKSTDKGATWFIIHQNYYIYDYHFINSSTGYMCEANGNVNVTTNGGLNWSFLINNSYTPTGICFADQDNGILIDLDGRGLMTSDGGLNWQSIFLAAGYSANIFYPDAGSVYVLNYIPEAEVSIIRKSVNRGLTWNSVFFGFKGISSMFFVNASVGYVAGSSGFISKTTNGGLNWTSQSLTSPENFTDISFINESTGWIANIDGVIYKTTDGGN